MICRFLLFAVCRANRLDGDDKDYGYIIDYMNLFGSLQKAFTDYTSGAFDAVNNLPKNIRNNKEAVAETIEINIRKVIIEASPTNPMYYEKMSVLLDELIQMRKREIEDYEAYLQEVVELTKKVKQPATPAEYSSALNSNAKRSLYDNLGKNEKLAKDLDQNIISTKKDRWRDTKIKQREVELVVKETLANYG